MSRFRVFIHDNLLIILFSYLLQILECGVYLNINGTELVSSLELSVDNVLKLVIPRYMKSVTDYTHASSLL